jgi:hypothetical protein
MPEANCMGETALHYYSCRGEIAAVRKLLPMCDADYIMQRSKFRQTLGVDALHTALIFQNEDVADAIFQRLSDIWIALPFDGIKLDVKLLRRLLTTREPASKVTTIMLICR